MGMSNITKGYSKTSIFFMMFFIIISWIIIISDTDLMFKLFGATICFLFSSIAMAFEQWKKALNL
jgi:hypothetical protein